MASGSHATSGADSSKSLQPSESEVYLVSEVELLGDSAMDARARQIREDVTAPSEPRRRATEIYVELLAGFEGRFERPRASLAYRTAALLCSMVMLLLVPIYIASILLIAWLTVYHVAHHGWILTSGWPALIRVTFFFGPVVCGFLLVILLVKPLFARPIAEPVQLDIEPDAEPLLWSLVEKISRTIRSPVPHRIVVDCSPNAAAIARHRWTGSHLTLLLGGPLLAYLRVDELAGIIAHELGHFSQGAGNRIFQRMGAIHEWFARVVYERDEWDAFIVSMANDSWSGIRLIFLVVFFGIGLTRAILGGFLFCSTLLWMYFSRQMEFDADQFYYRLVGAEIFDRTDAQITLLSGAGFHALALANYALEQNNELADNLPQLVAGFARLMGESSAKKIRRRFLPKRTEWFSTHPSWKERVDRARASGAAGVFHYDVPASVLFRDFHRTARMATELLYQGMLDKRGRKAKRIPYNDFLAKYLSVEP